MIDESPIKTKTERIAYTREEVLESSIKYFDGDELAATVWINKYALKDSYGNIYELNPSDMHRRLAKEISRIESKYANPQFNRETLFDLFDRFKYIVPQGSPMAGIGNDMQYTSLSNCFVIGTQGSSDSYGSIMKIDQEQVQLMKRRGGVGHDLSGIRPKSSPVENSALTSTGVVPFMERYSNSTREVAQDGRRGALMLSISMKHPDAEAFIDAKMTDGKVTGANVSVRIPDDYMEAVINNKLFKQQYPIDSKNPTFVKEVEAKITWKKIIYNAWKSAEPGVLFWDKIINESLPDRYADLGYKTLSTNPCGEIPLCADDSCRLIAVNLYSYVINPFTKEAKFDWDLFKSHARTTTRIMDNLIDLEIEMIDRILAKIDKDPEEESIKQVEKNLWTRIRKKCEDGRRTGIGITAEGDMIAAMGLRYGTKEATKFAEEVHMQYALSVYRESCNLAKERGAFAIWDPKREQDAPMLERIKKVDPELFADLMKYGRRNIALLTIAPTGSVSILTKTTSGIECAFLISYKRRKKVNPNDKNSRTDFVDSVGDCWEEYNVFHHHFETWLRVNGYDVEQVKSMKDAELNKIIEKSPYYKALSNDVDWVEKVVMQGKIQQWIDHSISVTVNLPESATEELVNEVYITAWKNGCKGCTIYRDGSRSGVLITKEEKEKEVIFRDNHAPKRPKTLDCKVFQFSNNKERWIGFIGLYDGRPYEIFTGKLEDFPVPNYVESGKITKVTKEGKNNYHFIYTDKLGTEITLPNLNHAFDDTFYDMAKTISAIMRHGMPLPYLIELIDGLHLDGDLITTWKSGVKRLIKNFIKDGTEVSGKTCKDCGSDSLQYKEGCLSCANCGSSKCG